MSSFTRADHDGRPRVLIVGGSGLVGRGLSAYFRRTGASVVATSSRALLGDDFVPFDLRSGDTTGLALQESHYRFAVLAAAVTQADRCEEQPETARGINVDGTLALTEKLFAANIVPVFLSSDYVFDGASPEPYDEAAMTRPLNEYGRQKLEVEQALAASGNEHLVVRLGRVVTDRRGGGCMLDEACRRLLSGTEYSAAADQRFSMIYVDDVARLIDEAMRCGVRGLIHGAAPGSVSRYELVGDVAAELSVTTELVRPCRLAEVSGTARRPLNTALHSRRAAAELGFAFTELGAIVAGMAASHRDLSR